MRPGILIDVTAADRDRLGAIVAVEGFFATLTKRRLRRGAFLGVVDLQSAINQYLAEHNVDPKPFKWQAHPDTIIAAAARGHQTLDSIH